MRHGDGLLQLSAARRGQCTFLTAGGGASLLHGPGGFALPTSRERGGIDSGQ